MNELDQLAIELTKGFKTVSLPPKLRYKVSKWLKSVSGQTPDKQADRRRLMETAKSELVSGLLAHLGGKPLCKNEVMASQYDNGSIRFDFGSDVPSNVKKAAMQWAKKRGLSPTEASMKKNAKDHSDYVICGSQPTTQNKKEILRIAVQSFPTKKTSCFSRKL